MKIIIILLSLSFLSMTTPEYPRIKEEHIGEGFFRTRIDNHSYIEHDVHGRYALIHDPDCLCKTWPRTEKD